jgi:hypothetical protein
MISYRVAETDAEYSLARKLLVSQGMDSQDMGFPTILAVDDEKLVGFIATTPRNDMILAGPLVLADVKMSALLAAQLVRLYINAMKNMGISSFVFYTDETDSPLGRGMTRMFPDIKPYAKSGRTMFYNWHIEGAA